MPLYFHKPENALKRANELIEVDKRASALEALHDVISSKRHRNWTKVSEQIVLLFLQLCVDMRRGKTAKDGLHQYKNMCQQVGIGSLETVIRRFVALSEAKAEEARAKATEVAEAMLDNVDDLEATETPESLILNTVTGEGNQDRTDREVLTPWLKFLWESYRTVLEILRNNPRLETLYQEIAQHAFKFCLKYTRKTEFRRLCDLLRTHLLNVQKYSNQSNSINLNNPESLQLQLETRFSQLEAAAKLDLWQEAFRTIEDIHGLMGLSKKPPKPQMMAVYFEQLALIFWKSENYLFHAYAWHKLFWLSKEQKKTLTEEEASRLATHCVLATLLVPVPPKRAESEEYLEIDSGYAKQQQQALIVGLSQPPTSASLIAELRSKNALQYVPQEVSNLFHWLEEGFYPLDLCKKVAPIMDWMQEQEQLAAYVKPLQKVAMTRLLQQLSKVYQVMCTDSLCALVPFATRFEIEKFLVDAVRQKVIQVRLCHGKGSISFGADAFYATETATDGGDGVLTSANGNYLLDILKHMSKVVCDVSTTVQGGYGEAKAQRRAKAMQMLAALVDTEHKRTLERKVVIENRKILLEEAIQRKNKQAAEQRAQQKAHERQLEQQRLEAESTKRQLEQRQREKVELEKQMAMEKVVAMKKALPGSKLLATVKVEELAELDAETILAKQVQQLDKEKRELMQRLKMVERKVDHFERAKCLEEIPKLIAFRDTNKELESQYEEEARAQELEQARRQHAKDLMQKERVAKMVDDQAKFVAEIRSQRLAEYEETMKEFNNHIQAILAEKREQRRIKRQQEQEAREEEERLLKEEEARRLEEERKREEEEERLRKLKEEREAEQQKLAEAARIQREKEREIEEKLNRQKAEAMQQTESRRGPTADAPPPVRSWRQRAEENRPSQPSGGHAWIASRGDAPRDRESSHEGYGFSRGRDRFSDRFGDRYGDKFGSRNDRDWGDSFRDREREGFRSSFQDGSRGDDRARDEAYRRGRGVEVEMREKDADRADSSDGWKTQTSRSERRWQHR